MRAEKQYLALLGFTKRYLLEAGQKLTLLDADGNVLLAYEPAPGTANGE